MKTNFPNGVTSDLCSSFCSPSSLQFRERFGKRHETYGGGGRGDSSELERADFHVILGSLLVRLGLNCFQGRKNESGISVQKQTRLLLYLIKLGLQIQWLSISSATAVSLETPALSGEGSKCPSRKAVNICGVIDCQHSRIFLSRAGKPETLGRCC